MWETSNRTFVSVPSPRFGQNIPKSWHNMQHSSCRGNLIKHCTFITTQLKSNIDDEPEATNPIRQQLECWETNRPFLCGSPWHRCLFRPYLPMWVWECEDYVCSLAARCGRRNMCVRIIPSCVRVQHARCLSEPDASAWDQWWSYYETSRKER